MGPELSREIGLEAPVVEELREAAACAAASNAAEVTVAPSSSGFPGGACCGGGGGGGVGPTDPSAFPSSLATQNPAAALPPLLTSQLPPLPDVTAMLAEALSILDREALNAAKLAILAMQARGVAASARAGRGCQTCHQELAPELADEVAERHEATSHTAEVKEFCCCVFVLLLLLSLFRFDCFF